MPKKILKPNTVTETTKELLREKIKDAEENLEFLEDQIKLDKQSLAKMHDKKEELQAKIKAYKEDLD